MPVALAGARAKLEAYFPGEVEDIALEALEELVEKKEGVTSLDHLRNLTISIAHGRAISLLRKRFSKKRGAGETVSLDESVDGDTKTLDVPSPESQLDNLNQGELAELLDRLQVNLKQDYREALNDFHLLDLSYEEIASKHGWARGTVSSYLNRGMKAIREAVGQHPKLMKELKAFLRLLLLL